MLTTFNFDLFLEDNPELAPLIVRTEGKWGRVICKWQERSTGYEHIYTPQVNLNTGEMYLDCTKKVIYKKFLLHIFLRPLHIFFKTIFHLTLPVSIPCLVYYAIKTTKTKLTKKEIAEHCLKEIAKSLVDIVSTPIFGIALMVVGIAAVIITPFAPKTIYDFRETLGRIIRILNWNQSMNSLPYFLTDIFACFEVSGQLKKNGEEIYDYSDTIYPEDATFIEVKLSNLARSRVKHLRSSGVPFYNSCKKIDPNVCLISPSYSEVEEKIY